VTSATADWLRPCCAAVYGNPAGGICDEELALALINPYGTSILMSEWMLRDQTASSDFRYVSLRHFNVAGSDLQGRIGQSTRAATLLIKVVCEAIVGKRPHVSIFGTDYDTPDRQRGARLRARRGRRTRACRCARLPASRRRPGDPPRLIARAERIRLRLGWPPQLDNLDAIVDSALRWERKLQREPW
jgi:UDP-glucose 4-epimerase